MEVIVARGYGWARGPEDAPYWYAGEEKPARSFADFCLRVPQASLDEVKSELLDQVGNFAVIVQLKNRVIAAVDKVRSYPVFYFSSGNGFSVSNSGRELRERRKTLDIDELALLEFRMASFVTGRETICKNLYQLQAGEFLVWDEVGKELFRRRYYVFFSKNVRQESEDQLIEELGERTDRIFERIARDAGGSPIWVPISGGLDSRLVLCKLKQIGYADLCAFSYGPPRNYEAKWGRYVAEKVGVPWLFVPYRGGDIRRFFFSKVRKDYWRFSGELCSLPFMVDEYALYYLKREKLIPDDAVIINGQSGDFISGGHSYGYHSNITPDDKRKHGIEAVVSAIVKKHYSLDSRLLTRENLERISEKIVRLLGVRPARKMDAEEVAKYYEWWEWQERQSKYVVNGQRSYDFFGHRWHLPLWADEYLEFWPQISFSHRFKQGLYKAYLEKMDFYGLFKNFKPVVWHWQGPSLLVIPVARAIRVLLGERTAEGFYHYMSYFGKYHNHYAPFGIGKWIANARHLKAPFPFYQEYWLREAGCI